MIKNMHLVKEGLALTVRDGPTPPPIRKAYAPLSDKMLDGLEILDQIGALNHQEATRHLLSELRRVRQGIAQITADLSRHTPDSLTRAVETLLGA